MFFFFYCILLVPPWFHDDSLASTASVGVPGGPLCRSRVCAPPRPRSPPAVSAGAQVKELNRRVCELMGFDKWVPVSGQTYSRKIDYQVTAGSGSRRCRPRGRTPLLRPVAGGCRPTIRRAPRVTGSVRGAAVRVCWPCARTRLRAAGRVRQSVYGPRG